MKKVLDFSPLVEPEYASEAQIKAFEENVGIYTSNALKDVSGRLKVSTIKKITKRLSKFQNTTIAHLC